MAWTVVQRRPILMGALATLTSITTTTYAFKYTIYADTEKMVPPSENVPKSMFSAIVINFLTKLSFCGTIELDTLTNHIWLAAHRGSWEGKHGVRYYYSALSKSVFIYHSYYHHL